MGGGTESRCVVDLPWFVTFSSICSLLPSPPVPTTVWIMCAPSEGTSPGPSVDTRTTSLPQLRGLLWRQYHHEWMQRPTGGRWPIWEVVRGQ